MTAPRERPIGSGGNDLLVCVPNWSEGRRPEVVETLVRAMERCRGAVVLSAESDPVHHRTVTTLAGTAEALCEAVRAGAGTILHWVDLGAHEGLHPRIGALDVCPFVPFEGNSMESAIACAHRTGERLWRELGVPVYFYGEAARIPERRDLSSFRNLGFEVLAERTDTDPSLRPDLGGPAPHPTAGATAVGARGPLLAFNMVFEALSPREARRVASLVRERDGGLPGVKALGLPLGAGRVQVSMNLVDPARTGLLEVFDAVLAAAEARGGRFLESELVGLPPRAFFDPSWAGDLRLRDSKPERRVLERRMAERGLPVGGE